MVLVLLLHVAKAIGAILVRVLLRCVLPVPVYSTMFRRASTLVGRVAVRGVHTEAKLQQMGIELPTPKTPLGGTFCFCIEKVLSIL